MVKIPLTFRLLPSRNGPGIMSSDPTLTQVPRFQLRNYSINLLGNGRGAFPACPFPLYSTLMYNDVFTITTRLAESKSRKLSGIKLGREVTDQKEEKLFPLLGYLWFLQKCCPFSFSIFAIRCTRLIRERYCCQCR